MVIASANIEGGYGLPFECHGVEMQFQNFVKAVKYRCGNCNILHKYSMRYLREVIKRVNKNKDEHKYQKIITHTGLVKLLSLRNAGSSQIDTRLAWIMFHNIASMYRDLKNQ